MTVWPDILASRYRLGGRQVGAWLDCYGTAIEVVRRLGLCVEDQWALLRRDWLAGRIDAHTGLPSCWVRTADSRRLSEGDLLLYYGQHPWVAAVAHGHVWSADASLGAAYCLPVWRWRRVPAEVWRHDPARCASRAARH